MDLVETVLPSIFVVRGVKAMIDSDLAALYEVETKRPNEQVKRNIKRFPDDFMFQLTKDEYEILKSQSATSSWGGRRTMPYAFTEHGIAMLSSVLTSEIAVDVNIEIMRAFVKMRKLLSETDELRLRLDAMEQRYDHTLEQIIKVISNMQSVDTKGNPIGFIWPKSKDEE